jgi:hypothetical protein
MIKPTREEIQSMAIEAGFGGQQRNHLAVKIERLVRLAMEWENAGCAAVVDEVDQHLTDIEQCAWIKRHIEERRR